MLRRRWLLSVLASLCLHGGIGLAWLSSRPAGLGGEGSMPTEVDAPHDPFAMDIREPRPPVVVAPPTPAVARRIDEPGTLPKLPDGPAEGTNDNVTPVSVTPPPNRPGISGEVKAGQVVAFVIDRSSSMAAEGALQKARAAVAESLKALRDDARFVIVAYNGSATRFGDAPLPATHDNVQRARQWMAMLSPEGRSDHVAGWRSGMQCRPDVLVVATDAADLSLKEVQTLRASHRYATRVTVALVAEDDDARSPLRMWLKEIGGQVVDAK